VAIGGNTTSEAEADESEDFGRLVIDMSHNCSTRAYANNNLDDSLEME
jgi:hypothetical protein